jgi:Tetratricopeptide repeat
MTADGYALLAQGRSAEALAHSEAMLADAPDCTDALVLRGAALKALGQFASAIAAFECVLRREPSRAEVLVNLGNAHAELGHLEAARWCLERALMLRPKLKAAHASLIGVCAMLGRDDLTEAACRTALAVDPALVNANQYLAGILARRGETAAAQRHRDAAYRQQTVFVEPAVGPRPRALVLLTARDGNIPLKYLLSRDRYTVVKWLIDYATPGQAGNLPGYDVVFNAIGEPDLPASVHAAAEWFRSICPLPFINFPERVQRTCRTMLPELLRGVPDLVVPPVRLWRSGEAVDASALPALLRPVGAHGGEGLVLARTREELVQALAGPHDSYLTAFLDFRSPDGAWRKYRMVFIDRRPYPYHLAIADHWLVHYYTSNMAAHHERREEERRFLANPAAAIGAPALAAVTAVGERLGFDYGGIDFSVLADGRVLVFEANATMVVHPETPDGPFAYKNKAVQTILDAFDAMVARRIAEAELLVR